MSVFAGEEIAEARKALKALEKANANLETDRDRLADLLRDEKAAHQRTARAGEDTAEALRVTRLELDRFRAIAQTVDQANDARGQADRVRNAAVAAREKLEVVHARTLASLDETVLERDDLRQHCADLEAELGPTRALVAAWKQEREAQETAARELEKLA
jgi:hypothetical protein